MAELLAYLARELVDDPEAVRVETEERDGALVLVLHVAPDDLGKVIAFLGSPDSGWITAQTVEASGGYEL